MDCQRRAFLKRTLMVAGAAAGAESLAKLAKAQEPAPASQPALTHDHHLMQIQGSEATPMKLQTAHDDPRRGMPGRKWIMVIDLAKCDGCGKCTVACSKMHFVPPDRQWIKVLRMQESEETAPYFFAQPCYQCDNPPCTKVCPVNATFKRQDGIVLIDNERCIGCRFCMAACPYRARSFNWGQPQDPPDAAKTAYSPEHGFPRRIGTVEKCDFCPDMAAQGMLPGCTAGCPMGAIYYGDENEDAVTNSMGETQRLSKLMADRSGYRHLDDLGTQPRVYYLPPKNRAFPGPGPQKEAQL